MNSKMARKYVLFPAILSALAINGWASTLTFGLSPGMARLLQSGGCRGGNFYHFLPTVNADGFTTSHVLPDCVHNITPASANEATYTITTPSNPSKSITVSVSGLVSSPAFTPPKVTYTTPSSKACFFWTPGSQPSAAAVKVERKGSVSIDYDCDPHSLPVTVKSDVALPGLELGKKAPFNRVIVTLTNNNQSVYTLDANGNLSLPYNIPLDAISSVEFDCSGGGVGGASVCTTAPVKFDAAGMTLNVAAKMVTVSLPAGIVVPDNLGVNLSSVTPVLNIGNGYYPLKWSSAQTLARTTPAKTPLKTATVTASVNVPLFYSIADAQINAYCDTSTPTKDGCLSNGWMRVPARAGSFPENPLKIGIDNTSSGPFPVSNIFNLFTNSDCYRATNPATILDEQAGTVGNSFNYNEVLLTPNAMRQPVYLGYRSPGGKFISQPGVCSEQTTLAALNNKTAPFAPMIMKIDPAIYQYCGANASLYYSNGSSGWGQLSLANKPSMVTFNGAPPSRPALDVFLSCQPPTNPTANGGCPNDRMGGSALIIPATAQELNGSQWVLSTIKAPSCSGPYYVTFPVRYCTNATASNLKAYSDANCTAAIPDARTQGADPGHLTISLAKTFPGGSIPSTVYTSCGNSGSLNGCACVPTTSLNADHPEATPIDCSSNNITVKIPSPGWNPRHFADNPPTLTTSDQHSVVLWGTGSGYDPAPWQIDSLTIPSKLYIDMRSGNIPKGSQARASNYFVIYDPNPKAYQAGCGWFTTPSTYGGGLLYTIDGGTGPLMYYDCDD